MATCSISMILTKVLKPALAIRHRSHRLQLLSSMSSINFLARLTPPPIEQQLHYDGWQLTWRFLVFRPARKSLIIVLPVKFPYCFQFSRQKLSFFSFCSHISPSHSLADGITLAQQTLGFRHIFHFLASSFRDQP